MNPAVKFMSRALDFFPVQKDCKNLSIKYESSFLTLKSQEYKKEHCKKTPEATGDLTGKKNCGQDYKRCIIEIHNILRSHSNRSACNTSTNRWCTYGDTKRILYAVRKMTTILRKIIVFNIISMIMLLHC